ncbi:hypothetical protein NW759_015343 [Fusarium solani]|nr:hypothetical protein NW759_015343 [Fusarium solani]
MSTTPTPSAAAAADKGPLMDQLYDQLKQTFGNDEGSLFQMEMPTRVLEMGNYYYNGSDTINSQQVKPPAVAETEFRLADGMLDISKLVGGPNGGKLSEQYNEVLFSLAPANVETSSALQSMAPDQQHIMDWLYEEVPNIDPPASDLLSMIPDDLGLPKKPPVIEQKQPSEHVKALRDPLQTPKIPRIDLYQKLLDTYEAERFRWAQFKNDSRPDDNATQDRWNAYDRLLTTYAPVIDSKLEGLWSVLLVRDSVNHRVRKYISYLDIETASESLQRAKESLRASVTRSIDDTEDIYPVSFTPNNWAKYLSTNFRPEDLLSNVDYTRTQLQNATKERTILIMRRDALVNGRQDIKALEKAATDASNALRTAQVNMVKGYGDNAISCIQMYFDVVSKNAQNKTAAIKGLTDTNMTELNAALEKTSEPKLSPEQWNSLKDMQAKCLQNQANVATANDALLDAQMAASQARGSDPTNALEVMNERITSLTMDIDYYNKMLVASSNPMQVPITVATVDAEGKPITKTTDPEGKRAPDPAPALPPSQDGDGASVWTDFLLSSKASTSNGSGHSDSSSADTSKKASTQNTNIHIGFRAMKVTIDRPWFNAQLLGRTEESMHFNAAKISTGKPQEVHDKLDKGETVNGANCLLPSWASAFIVVKDVHIVMSSASTFDASEISDM